MEKISKSETSIPKEVMKNAEILWDYHTLYEPVEKSDFIVITGHDIRLIEVGVDLYKKGLAPIIVCSGGHHYGEVLGLGKDHKLANLTEAEVFKNRAIESGVDEKSLIMQDKSKNAGEVVTNVRDIFRERGDKVNKSIWVYIPDKQRRGKATLEKQWPEMRTIVTSLKVSMMDYCNEERTLEKLVKDMVGNMKRIIEYPKQGFQTEQEIPPEVQDAYDKLVKAGY